MEALHDVVKAGKAVISAHLPCSPGNSPRPVHSRLHGWSRFVSMQNHYNLVYREEEREMIPLCIDQGSA